MIKELTIRENEIVEELSKGYTIKEIAARNFISPHTVDTHLKKSKRKTRARTLAHLSGMFVSSLDNPKEFFKRIIATFFIGIQIFICASKTNVDLRRPSQNKTRTSRTMRGKDGIFNS